MILIFGSEMKLLSRQPLILSRFLVQSRGVYRPRYIALLDISSTSRAARDAVYRPRYIEPLEYSSTPSTILEEVDN